MPLRCVERGESRGPAHIGVSWPCMRSIRRSVIAGCLLIACQPQRSTPPDSAPIPATPEPAAQPDPPPEPTLPTQPDPSPEPEPPAQPDPPPVAQPETPPAGFAPIPAKRKQGFPGIAFTEVRAFAFDLRNDARPICERPLDPDGTTCKTVQKPGVVLTAEQTKRLLAVLARRGTWGAGSACWLPHHGFVFYDEAGVPVAEIGVCFLCDMLVASPAIPGAKKADEGSGYGLSDKGAAELQKLCFELGLPKCNAKSPMEFGRRGLP
jgi:hypothetical protein